MGSMACDMVSCCSQSLSSIGKRGQLPRVRGQFGVFSTTRRFCRRSIPKSRVSPESTSKCIHSSTLEGFKQSYGLKNTSIFSSPVGIVPSSKSRMAPLNVFKGLGDMFASDPGEKTRKKYQDRVDAINALEDSIQKLSDEALRGKTDELKGKIAAGSSLDDILVEAFAVVREASRRVLGLRPFDVQLIGGMILHEGQIAEMKTGEGKTLVATLPSYLNALSGKGVHVVTVNDYLARRDSEWVGQVHRFLGLEVGLVQQGLNVSLQCV